MHTLEVLTHINNETVLIELDTIIRVATDRKLALQKLSAYKLKPGDTVKFTNRIRPAYIAGLTAVVKQINLESVTVDCPLDPRYGRFSGLRDVRVPISLIAVSP